MICRNEPAAATYASGNVNEGQPVQLRFSKAWLGSERIVCAPPLRISAARLDELRVEKQTLSPDPEDLKLELGSSERRPEAYLHGGCTDTVDKDVSHTAVFRKEVERPVRPVDI